MKINITCVQMNPVTGDTPANLLKMERFIEQALDENSGTDLIVFPELITTGYNLTRGEFQALAETVPEGPSMRKMSALAAKYGIHLVYGFAQRDSLLTDVLYNSALLIDSSGEIQGAYQKVHPFGSENKWCRAGSNYPIFDTKIGKLGIMICWDTGFPEVARTYALKGADLLISATNWESPFAEDWDLLTRARAFDNTLPLAAANRVGQDKNIHFFGHSKIIGPTGNVLCALDNDAEGIISAEIDPEEFRRLRATNYPFFKDRRPDTYGELVRIY